MMIKILSLILIFCLITTPAWADTEILRPNAILDEHDILYVDGCDDAKTEWDNMTNNPYLNDSDTSLIHEISSDSKEAGDFSFANGAYAGASSSLRLAIDSVTLYLETKAEDAPGNDGYYVWIWDGTSWTDMGFLQPSSTTYAWETLDLSTKLSTYAKIDAAKMYLDTNNVGGGDDRYVRRAYLDVDYNAIELLDYPTATNNYDKVDETTSDGDTTYVHIDGGDVWKRDLYNLSDHTGSGDITNIFVYNKSRESQADGVAYQRTFIKSGTKIDGSVTNVLTTGWSDKSEVFTTDPNTGVAWTWDGIDALQAGVGLRCGEGYPDARCTQVWVVVNYTPVVAERRRIMVE